MNSDSDQSQPEPELPSGLIRLLLSFAIAAYLSLVLLGPLSNPISSAHLTRPIARKIAPFHQALFLGHGYRFFGPDPGPSHIIEYRIRTDDDSKITGRFPDRDSNWPRLLYHRWFMLSETIYGDRANLLDADQFQQIVDEMETEIEALRLRGELASARELVTQRELAQTDYDFRSVRTGKLLSHVANYLLEKHDGETIELFLRERLIARHSDTRSHIKLNDPRFLSDPRSIGTFGQEEVSIKETDE